MSNTLDVLDLWNKPISYQFSEEEKKEIKKYIPKKSFVVRYALYNKHSFKGKYVAFIIDSDRNAVRKSGVENFWTYIAERELTNIEYDEIVSNFGTNNRRFQVWYYKSVNHLMLDDLKYNVKTPEKFVKVCEEKGYTSGVQLKIEI